MPFRLVKGVYDVRCRHEHCPFNDHVKIEQEIMGVTEEDVRSEAHKVARDQAAVKHDSIYGRNHSLESPELRMSSGTILRLGTFAPEDAGSDSASEKRSFKKGEVILRRGEAASTVCEILAGSAYPLANKTHRYEVGDCFGVAALVPNQKRLSDVIAHSKSTLVAFYHLHDLRQSQPEKATRVVTQVMEDTLRVVDELGKTVDRLRKSKHRLAS
jgi:CRP-like cAMP-binding protein